MPNTKPLMGEIRGKMEKKALLHNKAVDLSEMFSTFALRKNLILICHTRVVHDHPAVFWGLHHTNAFSFENACFFYRFLLCWCFTKSTFYIYSSQIGPCRLLSLFIFWLIRSFADPMCTVSGIIVFRPLQILFILFCLSFSIHQKHIFPSCFHQKDIHENAVHSRHIWKWSPIVWHRLTIPANLCFELCISNGKTTLT